VADISSATANRGCSNWIVQRNHAGIRGASRAFAPSGWLPEQVTGTVWVVYSGSGTGLRHASPVLGQQCLAVV